MSHKGKVMSHVLLVSMFLHYMQRHRKESDKCRGFFLVVTKKRNPPPPKKNFFLSQFFLLFKKSPINRTWTKGINSVIAQRMASHLTFDNCGIPTDWRGALTCLYLSTQRWHHPHFQTSATSLHKHSDVCSGIFWGVETRKCQPMSDIRTRRHLKCVSDWDTPASANVFQ